MARRLEVSDDATSCSALGGKRGRPPAEDEWLRFGAVQGTASSVAATDAAAELAVDAVAELAVDAGNSLAWPAFVAVSPYVA